MSKPHSYERKVQRRILIVDDDVDFAASLADLLERFQEWRDNLPSSLEDSPTAEALDAVLELRGHVEDLQAIQLPKGFGRD